MRVKRKCEICGSEFFATNARSRFCSDECRKIGNNNRQKRFRAKHKEKSNGI